jgi:hypothetical protein
VSEALGGPAAGTAAVEERLRALRVLTQALIQVPGEVLAELAAYVAHPYGPEALAAAPVLPLPDEAHLDAWRGYAAEAAVEGAAEVLRRRLVQLRFPIAAGVGGDPAYRAAVLRGVVPPSGPGSQAAGVELIDPAGIELAIHPTPAGHLPVLVARERADFVTLVRALTARSEPVAVPEAMGACLVKGLVNQDRVARHRARWAAARGGDGDAEWQAELARLSADKGSYQDRLVLLSSGPYSAVVAAELGLSQAQWREESLAIRRDHECFHYLTLRLFGLMRSNALDEVVADLAGLLGAYGAYRPALARRFLGVDTEGALPEGARLWVYCAELSPPAREALRALVKAAIDGVERIVRDAGVPTGEGERGALLLRLAGLGLDGLAAS